MLAGPVWHVPQAPPVRKKRALTTGQRKHSKETVPWQYAFFNGMKEKQPIIAIQCNKDNKGQF
jgi:hypothetical protein